MDLKIKFPGDISFEEEFGYTWKKLSRNEKIFYLRYTIRKQNGKFKNQERRCDRDDTPLE